MKIIVSPLIYNIIIINFTCSMESIIVFPCPKYTYRIRKIFRPTMIRWIQNKGVRITLSHQSSQSVNMNSRRESCLCSLSYHVGKLSSATENKAASWAEILQKRAGNWSRMTIPALFISALTAWSTLPNSRTPIFLLKNFLLSLSIAGHVASYAINAD